VFGSSRKRSFQEWEIGFSVQFGDGRVQTQTWEAPYPVLP